MRRDHRACPGACFFPAFLIGALAMATTPRGTTAQNADYGVAEANQRFAATASAHGDAARLAVDGYDYFAFRDHIGPSGVPLGGIGVGCFDLAPDGRFTRIALNNIHRPPGGDFGAGCFFALYSKAGNVVTARRLVRDAATRHGMPGYGHTTYTGLFPTARLVLEDDPTSAAGPRAIIEAWSGFVPQNIKDSALPVAWFDVTLTSDTDADIAVALSWEDIIGRELRDPESLDGLDGQVFEGDRIHRLDAMNDLGRGGWPLMARVPTTGLPYRAGGTKGIVQSAGAPLRPRKATFQGYVSQVAIVAQTTDSERVTLLPAYDVSAAAATTSPNPDAHLPDPWKSFRETGSFPETIPSTAANPLPLSAPDSPPRASAVAIKATVRAEKPKTFRFTVVWYFPELIVDRATAAKGSFFGDCDYGRYFHNFFNDVDSLVAYAAAHRDRIRRETREWQAPILDSSLPDWLQFKILNSAYTLYTNTVLNKAGDFTVLEGGMAGLAGTMDQRISAHPAYQKFFTQLDRSEMQLFADTRDRDERYILHFVGHYYHGVATRRGRSPAEKNWMLDNTGGWILQLEKDYRQTGDLEYLRANAEAVRQGLAFLQTKIPPGGAIPVGPTTYDDFQHPPIYSYMAGMYLAILRAGASIGEVLSDGEMVAQCNAQFDKTRAAILRMLWNGRFFSYGCEIDGSKRRDDLLFTGQLAGQFVSRCFHGVDALPLDVIRASLISQFKTSLSHTPDYYANKVWDLSQGKGIDMPGSQCWPFYLESYTALPAIQAGYIADGLDILKHIQLVHLRKGWTWSMNLWNPGELAYMSAPVSWFVPDVLAGAGLDVPKGTLYLAPILPPGSDRIVLPIYFPRFWAMVEFAPSRRIWTLRILKTFGDSSITLRRVVVNPAGRPTSDGVALDIPPFTVATGTVLDLSSHLDRIPAAILHPAVLPRADKADTLEVPLDAALSASGYTSSVSAPTP